MAVPRKKVSRARRDMRRSHDRLRPAAPAECPHCGETRLPHHVCGHCGRYGRRNRARQVLPPADLD